MKPIEDQKVKERNIKLEEALKQEREEWGEKVKELVVMLKDNRKLAEAQVYQLSYRQQVQERIADYTIRKEKIQGILDAQISSRFREYSISYDIKLNGTEKMMFITGDLVAFRQQVNMIQAQIKYFDECVKTLDNFGFAVRNKLEIISQQLM